MPLPVWDPPADIAFAEPFWNAARSGQCVIPRCSACGRWQWYPDDAGADCDGADLVWHVLPGTGTVYSHTTVRRSFLPGQRERAPFTIVLVDLDGAEGVRLVGNLAEGAEPRVGQRVRFGTQVDGDRIQPVFFPSESEE